MRIRVLAAAIALGLLTGCVQPPTTPSASPSLSEVSVDLTEPGHARIMVRRLIAKAGSRDLIQVEITKDWAAITVVKNNQAETWAWRDNTIKQVQSDVAYVQQKIFNIEDFNINDVGALFRSAAGISGSDSSQQLQIVDSSAGEVFMSVSTNPESRTVFFNPDGSLLPTLDFNTESGIEGGLEDVAGPRVTALAIGIQSNLGAWLDFPGSTTTTIRRLRTSTVPVTINERSQRPELPLFGVSRVHSEAIWKVLDAARARGDFDGDTSWQVTIDDRARLGTPHMYFTIGRESFETNLAGEPITP
ncbi:MAG TPA: hypothetical protein VM429_00295 [Micropruina sp.]|nr:hypothetical protein [Micropruina sp.]